MISKNYLRLLFLSLLLISFSLWAEVSLSQNGSEKSYFFHIEGVEVISKEVGAQKFSQATLKGVDGYAGIIYEKGRPEIPVVRITVAADSDEDISVNFDEDKSFLQEEVLGSRLYPSQESLPKIRGSKINFVMNAKAYISDSYLPEEDFTIEDAGSVMGQTQKIITIYPFKYRPSTNEYILRQNFSVQVYSAENEELWAREYKEEVFAFIVGSKYKDNQKLQEYMTFKRRLGYKVEPIVIGRDASTPNDIRARLQGILKRSGEVLKYALIVGDAEDVPSKEAKHISGVTDHYYRAIDTDNYENDINGPDIGVGRLTVKNDAELNLVIEKLLRYQQGNFSNEDWLRQLSFVATDDRYQVAEGSHNYVINNYTKARGYTGIFPQANMPGGDQLYAITHRVSDATVVDAMRRGRAIIDYSGHGSTSGWAGPDVTQANVKSFNHPDARPFVIGNACVTGQFTVGESFGETWIKHPNGAIMYWGSMDSSYWDEDDILEKNMFDSIYRDGKMDFSSITNQALSAVWAFYGGANRSKYYWETYVIFGDPSINLRTAPVAAVSLSGPDKVTYGSADFNLAVAVRNGKAMANLRVGLELVGKGIYWHGYTDDSGKVAVPVPVDATVGDKLLVSVYGQDMKLLTKEIDLIASNEPFLMVTKMVVGNREQLDVYPHEQTKLNFTIKNVSPVVSSNSTLSIIKIDGPATALSGQAKIPALATNESYSHQGDGFGFAVANSANGTEIDVTFEWVTAEKYRGTFKRKFKVSRAELVVDKIDFGNPENQVDGSLGAGDSGKLFLTVINSGSVAITNGSFEIVKGSCLSSAIGNFAINKLMPGQSVRITNPLAVKVDASCSTGAAANFSVKGSHAGMVAQEELVGNGGFPVGRMVRFVREDRNLQIPILDKKRVSHPIVVENMGLIKDISVYIKLSHSYIGDLTIDVISPNGTKITIVEKEGGGNDDLEGFYDATGKLGALLNTVGQGEWKVEIFDSGSGDTGKLHDVTLKLLGYSNKR